MIEIIYFPKICCGQPTYTVDGKPQCRVTGYMAKNCAKLRAEDGSYLLEDTKP
jgi:hypothetical protein